MRYARFKKQMDKARENPPDTAPLPSPRRGRNPKNSTPKRSRVEKNESPKKIKRGSTVNVAALKSEASSFRSQEDNEEEGSEREGTVDSTADIPMGMKPNMADLSRIKRERLSHTQSHSTHAQLLAAQYAQPTTSTETQENSLLTPMASTPRYCNERSPSPSPSNNVSFDTSGEFTTSFGMSSQAGGMTGNDNVPSLFGEVAYGYDTGFEMGQGDVGVGSFESFWNSNGNATAMHVGSDSGSGSGTGKVAVKVEPRWEEQYRH